MSEFMFVLAVAWGAFFLGEISIKDNEEYGLGVKAKPLMELCEKNLPRNQKCILTAKPVITLSNQG